MTIASKAGVRTSAQRDLVCRALGVLPDRNNWSEGNVWMEAEALIGGADWPLVYDIIEDLHDYIAQRQPGNLEQFQTEINDHFRETGIGWQLVNGRIETRGPEAFEAAVRGGISALSDGGRPTASQELHEALLDLSRRPEPDRTGAVQHALAALECVARDASGDSKATLGTILQRHPGLFPKPLDAAAEKVWAFASEMGRHLREGREPSRLDTELVVGLAAVRAAHLERKLRVRQSVGDRAIDEPCSRCGERAVVMEEGCRQCLACGFSES
jgi:AbiJ N-terminal domain 4